MACYECYTVQCAYTGVSKNISSWYSSLGPNTHANLRQCARKKWVYFHNNEMYKKKLPTIKKDDAFKLRLVIESTTRTCATSFDVMDFSVLAHFIFVHIIIIVSQLHLFTPIYASWFILYMHFSLFFFSTEQKKKNKKQNPRKEKNFVYSSFICNLIPWSQAIGMCIHYSYA